MPWFRLFGSQVSHGCFSGAKEQAEEHMAGNVDAKDWQDEAQKIVEQMLSS